MCRKDNFNLIRLYESVEKMRPDESAPDEERAWWRGTLHGLKLALQQVRPDDNPIKEAA